MNETQQDFKARCAKLGLRNKTVGEMLATLSDFNMIVHDEFNHARRGVNYRESAINRAIESGVLIVSECNTIYEIAKRFITIDCPRCGTKMKVMGGGGTMDRTSVNYSCECGAKIGLVFPDDGISVDLTKAG